MPSTRASLNDELRVEGAHGSFFGGRLELASAKGWSDRPEATGADFYFALPRHPWQRGTNENTNGLLRERFPKGCDLSKATDEEVQEVHHRLNMRPRKCLGYRTPWEVHHSEVLHLV